jgi:hypothetical protein
MAEPTHYTFTYREVVEALIKKQDLHDGLWAIYIEFGIRAAHAEVGPEEALPVAVVPVLKIGLQRVEAGSNVPGTADASVVNPRT